MNAILAYILIAAGYVAVAFFGRWFARHFSFAKAGYMQFSCLR